MALRLPPLNALRLFEAAARCQSFKLAAAELHLTPSAVSHGILSLERWLGVELFDRTPRGIVLTSAGRDYFPYVTEALSIIATGTQRLPSRTRERRLRISAAPTFALRWLVPRLPAFRRLHPRIQVSLDTSHRQIGFPLDDVDVAIRMARGPSPGLLSELLVRERLLPVAAPDLARALARGGGIDWPRATLLHVSSASEEWAAWIERAGPAAAGLEGADLMGGLRFDTIDTVLEAAARGLGVALGRLPLVADDLAAGRLVALAEPPVVATTGYWLVGPAELGARGEVKQFRRWLVDEAHRCWGVPAVEAEPA